MQTKSINIAFIFLVFLFSCSNDFLTKHPLGVVERESLKSKAGIEALIIAAYSSLNPQHTSWGSNPCNWVYGSVVGGDAYKGSEAGDQPDINSIERYACQTNNGYTNEKWNWAYNGIFRCNDAISILSETTIGGDIDETFIKTKKGELRFLRGFYFFELIRMFGPKVPWLDETIIDQNINNPKIPNDKDITSNIQADFQFAADNLPETWDEIGRVNCWAAKAMLAKHLLYQHKYADAKFYFDDIIANGKTTKGDKYALLPSFEMNFNIAYENSSESIFAIQNDIGDGSRKHGNAGYSLCYPYGSDAPGGCCGFFQPSQSLVNSFKVDASGLPLLDSFNQINFANDDGLESKDKYIPDTTTAIDPRLDWSVGRRGIPYLDWGLHPGKNWIRDQNYGGPYSPIKNVYRKVDPSEKNDWWAPGSALNFDLIRFADVLLMAAECEVEVGSLHQATEYVNRVRNRAKSSNLVKFANGTPSANYVVEPYSIDFADKIIAGKAVRFERKIELAMEGHRFFDLSRWGITIVKAEIDAYIAKEGVRHTQFQGAKFDVPCDLNYPIPVQQIELSQGILIQNGSTCN